MPYNSAGSKGLSSPLAGELLKLERKVGAANVQRTTRKGQRVRVVLGIVIGHAGAAAVNIRAAQSFRVDFLAGGRANQRRAAEKDAPWLRTMMA